MDERRGSADLRTPGGQKAVLTLRNRADLFTERSGMPGDTFTTLTCPNCGAKRTVKPNSSSVVCEYCGSEYLLNAQTQKEMHASYSGCPVCHNNDRSEKVTSILAKQTQHIQGTTLQSQAEVTKKGKVRTRLVETPYNAVQASALAQRLNHPPSQPNLPPALNAPKPFSVEAYKKGARNKKIVAYIEAGAFILTGIGVAVGDSSGGSASSAGSQIAGILFYPIVGLILAAILWLWGNHEAQQIEHPEVVEKFEQASRARESAYEQAVAARNKQIEGYQRALDNWNNLYYCNRDDCVFVPGSGKSAPVAELESYLYTV
jgi:hypothetical protein